MAPHGREEHKSSKNHRRKHKSSQKYRRKRKRDYDEKSVESGYQTYLDELSVLSDGISSLSFSENSQKKNQLIQVDEDVWIISNEKSNVLFEVIQDFNDINVTPQHVVRIEISQDSIKSPPPLVLLRNKRDLFSIVLKKQESGYIFISNDYFIGYKGVYTIIYYGYEKVRFIVGEKGGEWGIGEKIKLHFPPGAVSKDTIFEMWVDNGRGYKFDEILAADLLVVNTQDHCCEFAFDVKVKWEMPKVDKNVIVYQCEDGTETEIPHEFYGDYLVVNVRHFSWLKVVLKGMKRVLSIEETDQVKSIALLKENNDRFQLDVLLLKDLSEKFDGEICGSSMRRKIPHGDLKINLQSLKFSPDILSGEEGLEKIICFNGDNVKAQFALKWWTGKVSGGVFGKVKVSSGDKTFFEYCLRRDNLYVSWEVVKELVKEFVKLSVVESVFTKIGKVFEPSPLEIERILDEYKSEGASAEKLVTLITQTCRDFTSADTDENVTHQKRRNSSTSRETRKVKKKLKRLSRDRHDDSLRKLKEISFWELTKTITMDYKELGRKLEIPNGDILDIKMRYETLGHYECVFQVLLLWKELYPRKCTFSNLKKIFSNKRPK